MLDVVGEVEAPMAVVALQLLAACVVAVDIVCGLAVAYETDSPPVP